MDDIWANAWHEPAKRQPSDAETDIALPSWSTGTAVSWAEPSTDQSTLWVPSEPLATAWASPYDNIPLGKPSPSVSPQVDHESPLPSIPPPEPASPEPTLEPIQEPEIRSTIHNLPSPDAFGMFETVLKADEPDLDPWAAELVVAPADTEQEDVWVPSWGASDHEVRTGKPPDEWEEAKRQKARQDEHVPPELLAAILEDFKALSSDLWPTQSPPEDPPRARSGLENVEGLDFITNRLMPHDLTLPSSVQFYKTFTAKHMGDALRLSRHVPITRLSPFTLYMASKGSTAWEVSIKSRSDVANDDFLLPGWRVVEKEKEEPLPIVEMKKKGSGGLLSFFGRKSANPSVETNPRRSESPGRSASISSNGTVSSPVTRSTRPSLDSAKSPTRSSTPNLLGTGPVADSTPIAPVPSSQITVPGTAEQTPQAPSAVSRFLGRFVRSKTSGPGMKESLALSTDDLDFLSDIVPSANDEADENDQLKGLSDMLNRPSLSTALPPLLAPPPRALSTSLVSENLASQPSKSAAHPQADPFSVFDSPSTMSKPTTPETQPIAPSLPPPQLSSTSIPPLRPPTSSLYGGESQGALSSSRFNGRSSPFDTSALTPRSQTPSSGRRVPIAIMSTGSSSSSNSGSIATLPSAPILPPPPPAKFTSTPSHSRASSQHNILKDDHDLASFRATPVSQLSLLSDSSTSSFLSDQSLVSNASSHHTKSNSNLFDDFDDFISSPIRDPSPPRPPAKPSLLSQPPIAPSPEVPPQHPPQPPTKHPSPPPRKGSRAADYQRTLSLVNLAASRTGRWPAPPSPLPELLPPPPEGPHASSTSSIAAPLSSMEAQQKNAISAMALSTSPSSGFPFLTRPPPGFSGLQTSTMSPSPPPRPGTASSAPMVNLMQKGLEVSPAPAPASSAPKYTPSATPGGLSAQDLSFFEGL